LNPLKKRVLSSHPKLCLSERAFFKTITIYQPTIHLDPRCLNLKGPVDTVDAQQISALWEFRGVDKP
jgi:hypothetical protein